MNKKKLTRSFSKYAIVPIAAAVFMAAGCKPLLDDRNSSSSGAIYEVQILGDSYFDFDYHIPNKLKEEAGVEYYDRSVTNAELSDADRPDISDQFDAAMAEEEADGTYEVRTIIINGGANDLKSPCVTSKNLDGLSKGCSDALVDTGIAIKELIDKMSPEVDYIVWAGRYYMAESTAPKAAIDAHNENIIAACNDSPNENCYFVEVRGSENDVDDLRWSYPAKADGPNIISDGQHVTAEGGVKIGTLIWQVMQENSIYRN